jgi:hypothetical protein
MSELGERFLRILLEKLMPANKLFQSCSGRHSVARPFLLDRRYGLPDLGHLIDCPGYLLLKLAISLDEVVLNFTTLPAEKLTVGLWPMLGRNQLIRFGFGLGFRCAGGILTVVRGLLIALSVGCGGVRALAVGFFAQVGGRFCGIVWRCYSLGRGIGFGRATFATFIRRYSGFGVSHGPSDGFTERCWGSR